MPSLSVLSSSASSSGMMPVSSASCSSSLSQRKSSPIPGTPLLMLATRSSMSARFFCWYQNQARRRCAFSRCLASSSSEDLDTDPPRASTASSSFFKPASCAFSFWDMTMAWTASLPWLISAEKLSSSLRQAPISLGVHGRLSGCHRSCPAFTHTDSGRPGQRRRTMGKLSSCAIFMPVPYKAGIHRYRYGSAILLSASFMLFPPPGDQVQYDLCHKLLK